MNDLQAEMLVGTEDSIHIYLGSSELLAEPVWEDTKGRHRSLDFPKSYAVQLVPSIIAPDHNTLLQGSLGIMRRDQYDDPNKTKELVSLYRRLRKEMQNLSDRDRIIVQTLTGGEKKAWKDIFVGKQVPEHGLQLKQFIKGPVVFGVEAV